MRILLIALALATAGFSHEPSDSWILIDGNNSTVHMSGDTLDLDHAQRAVGKGRGLCFSRDGKTWIISDGKIVARAFALTQPTTELGKKQGELGAKQGALGARQGELGARQGELGRRMGELAGRGAEQETAALEKEMDKLGRKQEELGRQQEALGHQQEILGKQQEAAARVMEAKMKELIEQAVAAGLAKPAP
jgi:hypothetical protein